ncbi:uncharacterized protein PAC_20089 [Phialocephala subalpina]|uniref:Uncharacterized protein n=1 Tax=Phialocephala subalpina TaxID=576137 RepID=A0A1L7XYT9_9HELO|nr:uncharacterized protein PAC_20089 [Phialocephala subalpina]
MASRSFKPASYLASAAQAPNRSPRPSFTRTSSSSSTTSEDSLIATLQSMKAVDKDNSSAQPHIPGYTTPMSGNGAGAALPRRHIRQLGIWGPTRLDAENESSSSLSRDFRQDTPGRKRSQPIAIELPHKAEQVYTPLSARGDLPGGYFPHHDPNHKEVPRFYRSHPFGDPKPKPEPEPESPIMSATSSLMSSPASETTPRGPAGLVSPAFGPLSPSIEPLIKPVGKYHPANYISPATTQVSTPTSAPRLLPPTNLSIPTSNKRSTKDRPGHERKNSDVKRKIQQYQKDMIAQARSAASTSIAGTMNGMRKEPNSPRLQPAGSPGPITPFELEELENDGYIAAGHRVRTNTLIAEGLQRDRQETMNALQRLS